MKNSNTGGACLLFGFFISVPVEVVAIDFDVHGYFNAVAGRMSNERIRFDGYDSGLSVDRETQLSLQVHAQAQQNVSMVGQWLGNASKDDSFDLQWAYLDLRLDPAQSLHIGKALAPFYRYSESLNVAYSYPWIRPPYESYNLSSLITINGLQYIYHQSLNLNWDFSSQIYYGGFRGHVQSVADQAGSELKKFSGIVAEVENDWALIRLGYHQALTTIKLDVLEPGGELYEALLAGGENDLINQLRLYDKKARFYGLALDINRGHWQWLSEITIIRMQRNIVPTHRGWYTMLAYQWKPSWLLHVTYSALDSELHYNFHSNTAALQPAVDQALRGAESVQHSVTSGMRYEFKPGYAYKLEWQRFFLQHNHGNFYDLAPGVEEGHSDFFNIALNLAF